LDNEEVKEKEGMSESNIQDDFVHSSAHKSTKTQIARGRERNTEEE
jgi:hypothetical protein